MRKIALILAVVFLSFNLAYSQVENPQMMTQQQIEMSQQMEFIQQQADIYQQVEAQHQITTDGFFTTNYQEYRETDQWINGLPVLPSSHGLDYDVAAPIGSGLLLMLGMGLGYMTIANERRD